MYVSAVAMVQALNPTNPLGIQTSSPILSCTLDYCYTAFREKTKGLRGITAIEAMYTFLDIGDTNCRYKLGQVSF